MARADLLKALFRSYKAGDTTGFAGAAREIIEEERKKAHFIKNHAQREMNQPQQKRQLELARHPSVRGARGGPCTRLSVDQAI